MSKQDLIRIDGVIDETLPNTQFIVKLENGHKVLCHISEDENEFHQDFTRRQSHC